MNILNQRLTLICLCLVLLVGLAGCDSQAKHSAIVQGAVTVDGELAKSGSIVLHPSFEGAPTAYGSIRSDGTYSLRVGQGNQQDPDKSKIIPGEYVATVMIRGPSTPDEELGPGAPPKAGPRLSAAKYSNKEMSGLSYMIKPGLNVINISVEAASEEELLEEAPREDAEATESTEPAEDDEADTVPAESGEPEAPAETEEHPTEEASP